jgi:sulfhydrogenase subunit gamma (sulfur reductase)
MSLRFPRHIFYKRRGKMDDNVNIYTVQWVKAETPQMNLISLNGPNLWTFIPGQVAVLGVAGIGESYYALASAPEEKTGMEFLVKNGEGVSKALYETREGDQVQAKGPVGKGFPIDQYRGRDFLIAAVGSAIAPMRSVIGSICQRRGDFGKISLIFGARHPEDFPFQREVNDWQKADIEVILSVSRPEGTNVTGATGHCQVHFSKTLAGLNHPVAMTCGMKAMQQESHDELVRLGLSPEEVPTNY